MSENGTVAVLQQSGIREATIYDVDLFRELWTEYVQCEIEEGQPEFRKAAIEAANQLFVAYMQDILKGIVLFGAFDNAVLCWGESGTAMHGTERLGQVGLDWGTYVRPAHRREGWSRRMRETAASRLKEMGFDTVLASVWSHNEAGAQSLLDLGAVPYQQTFKLRL